MKKFIYSVLASAVVLLLSSCAHHGPRGEQTMSDAAAKEYAFQADSGYTGQVRRNGLGQIINPMVAPANQTYYFDLNSDVFQSEYYRQLTLQAEYLVAHPRAMIRLEGHADDRGSREYNIALGWRRDQAVERFLMQNGVSTAQIKAVSYGKERPAVLGNNEYAWRLNRRVNLIYEVK